jgi:hypothetical protein
VYVQEDVIGGTSPQDRIVQHCDKVFITEFGTSDNDGGSKDNEYGSLVTLRRR